MIMTAKEKEFAVCQQDQQSALVMELVIVQVVINGLL